jgi:anti-sigma28 factor (negative regulator of flagellin synthesis)
MAGAGEGMSLKATATSAEVVGMSDINRPSTRRSAIAAPRAPFGEISAPSRVEALRKLVAAGQYHVSPRWLATKIFHAAGVKVPE